MKNTFSKIVIISLFLATYVFSQTPLLLNYQGKLFDQNSEPLNTTADITFKIFSVETEGSELWSETHTSVAVSNGVFNVMLGSVTTLSGNVFTEAGNRYLEITVDSETLSPRFQLVSVAYAIRAAEADSVQDGAIDTQHLRDGAVTQTKLDEGITAIPSGSAGGDLTGTYPNPSVNGILGRAISLTSPADGQVLKYDDGASEWVPANDISGGDGTVSTTARLSGDGSSGSPLDIAQQGATTNQVLQWDGSTWGPGTISVTGGNTLDQAYDQGGAGVGRTITADNGAVNIAGSGGLTVTGDVSANAFSGDGASLTSLNATNLSSGTVPSGRLDADLVDLIDGSLSGSKVGSGISATNITTGTLSNSVLSSTVSSTILTADDRIGIGTNTPLSAYSLDMLPRDKAIGIRIDFNQTTNNTSNYGVYIDLDNTNTANANNYGYYANVYKTGGTYSSYGFYGWIDGSSTHTGPRIGVYGRAENNDNTGIVYGVNGSAVGDGTGDKRGVYGTAGGAGTAYGVYGYTNGTGMYTYGVFGEGAGTGSRTYGVRGINGTRSGYLAGNERAGEFYHSASCWAFIAGNSLPDGSGVLYAGSFVGDVTINGTLSKSAGAFKIDHPLDPANKYLSHSFVESPDMKNIYDGVIILDNKGEATVTLPDWFEALNKDFRYQLTPIGAPGPNLYIAQEISNNQFKIAGGTAGMKVSWHVTGIRNDAYARAHRIKVEEDKSATERGKYLNPSVFGLSKEMSIMRVESKDNNIMVGE
ncbi:MAG: hypothetical protein P8Y99_05070 [Calditrichaceae bacterium]